MNHVLSHIGQQQIEIELGLRIVLLVIVSVCQEQEGRRTFLHIVIVEFIEKLLFLSVAEMNETNGQNGSYIVVAVDRKFKSFKEKSLRILQSMFSQNLLQLLVIIYGADKIRNICFEMISDHLAIESDINM